MNNVTEIFGSMVFNDSVMRARLPKDVFRQVQRSMSEGSRLDTAAATVVATGDLMPEVLRHCKRDIVYDHDLLVKGLFILYKKNTEKNRR